MTTDTEGTVKPDGTWQPGGWGPPCRPLFLCAGSWAVLVPLVWLLPSTEGAGRALWHSRELLLGVVGAAAGGYLLTSLPAWASGRMASPALTWATVSLWILARVIASAWLLGDDPRVEAAAGWANFGYFSVLALALAVPLAQTRMIRKAWAPMALLLVAGVATSWDEADLSVSLQTLPFALLLTYIGGRAVPAFTAAWLLRSGTSRGSSGKLPRMLPAFPALLLIASASLAEAQDWTVLASGVWMVAAAAVLERMSGWLTVRTWRYPALFWLHVAYAWVPLAFLLRGLALAWPDVIDAASAHHALTIGAMGGMMMAMMLRPAMKRVAGHLLLSPMMRIGLALLQLSALMRIAGPLVALDLAVQGAALAWVLAWVSFLCAFWPAIAGPVPRPAFSARLN